MVAAGKAAGSMFGAVRDLRGGGGLAGGDHGGRHVGRRKPGERGSDKRRWRRGVDAGPKDALDVVAELKERVVQ